MFGRSKTTKGWIENEVDRSIRDAMLVLADERPGDFSQAVQQVANADRLGMRQVVEVIGIIGVQDVGTAIAVADSMDVDEALEGLLGFLLKSNSLWGRYRRFFEAGPDDGHSVATRFDQTARVVSLDTLASIVSSLPRDSDWFPGIQRVAREYSAPGTDPWIVEHARVLARELAASGH
jgi:hypothetical protein